LNGGFNGFDDGIRKIANLNELPTNTGLDDGDLMLNIKLACAVLFNTANLFLLTKIALCPLPFLPSTEESFTSP
jgi:hypothetical protein